MPDTKRIYCTRCGQSVYNCLIPGADGTPTRVPIVTRIVVGQPADTGPKVPLNDPQTRLTSFTRTVMLSPLARIELCEKCVSELFGWPLVTAAEDPMYDAELVPLEQRRAQRVLRDDSIPLSERMQSVHMRSLQAPAVAWGQARPALIGSGQQVADSEDTASEPASE